MDHSELESGFNPEQRELCPDGACVGVIGPDGRCKICGAASPNPPPEARSAQAVEVRAEAAPSAEAPDETAPVRPRDIEGDDFDPDRRELCPDGACLGVLGPDGRCKICGKPGPGAVENRGEGS